MSLSLTLNALASATQNVGLAVGECEFYENSFIFKKTMNLGSFYYPGTSPGLVNDISLPNRVSPECYISLQLACYELAFAYHEIGSKDGFPHWLEEYLFGTKTYPSIKSPKDISSILKFVNANVDPNKVDCLDGLSKDLQTMDAYRPTPPALFPNFNLDNPSYRVLALKKQSLISKTKPTNKNWDVVVGTLQKNPSLIRDVFFNVLKRHGLQALKTLKDIIITGGKIGTAAVKIGAAFTVGLFDTVLSILFNAGALDVDGQGGLKSGYSAATTLENPLLDDEFESLIEKEFLFVTTPGASSSVAPSSAK